MTLSPDKYFTIITWEAGNWEIVALLIFSSFGLPGIIEIVADYSSLLIH